MGKDSRALWLLLPLAGLLFPGCAHPSVFLDATDPPTLRVDVESIEQLSVLQQKRGVTDELYFDDSRCGDSIVWQIQRLPGSRGVRNVVYGEVPDGYRQAVPEDGGVPPSRGVSVSGSEDPMTANVRST